LTIPFTYPPDGNPRPRAALPLLQETLLEKIVCQAPVTQDVLYFCPYILPQHPLAHSDDFLSLSFVLAPILDNGRDILTSDMSCEDDGHTLWDSLIRRPLSYLCECTGHLNLHFARNSTDKYKSDTLTKFSRPDFLCYMQKTLILRGEEKRSQEGLEIARQELIDKFAEWSPMFYGKLPFVFGYATGGLNIQYVLSFSFIISSLKLGLDICGYTG
jgi:hypothetical protein